MTCKDAIEVLAQYLEGGLDADLHASFEKHLLVCRHCRAYLQTYRQTVELLGDLARHAREGTLPEPPEPLVRSVLAILNLSPPEPRTA